MIYNNIQKKKLQLDPCIICGASLREHTVVKLEKKFDLDGSCVSDTNYTVNQSIGRLVDNYTALD